MGEELARANEYIQIFTSIPARLPQPSKSEGNAILSEYTFYGAIQPARQPASQPAGQAGNQPSTVQVKTFLYEFEYEHRRMGGMGEWLDDCYSVYCVVHAYTFAQTNELVKMSYSQ